MLTPDENGDRAIAINLACDHRVSKEREAEITRVFNERSDRGAQRVRGALNDYFLGQIRATNDPAFLQDNNTRNEAAQMHGSTLLVTLLDLNGLRIVLNWGRMAYEGISATAIRRRVTVDDLLDRHELLREGGTPAHVRESLREFRLFPQPNAAAHDLSEWFDARMNTTEGLQRAFLGRVFRVMQCHRLEGGVFNPVWVSLWKSAQRFLTQGFAGNTWQSTLGVQTREPGRWIVKLVYRKSLVGKIYHPTQLDAGDDHRHFPPPPPQPGGHPMQLSDPPTQDPLLLDEFVHQQVDFREEHVRGAARTNAVSSFPLQIRRQKHWSLLDAHYGGIGPDWMPAP